MLLCHSLKTVDCTLWNSFVDKVADLRGMDAPILSISNVRVSDYQGGQSQFTAPPPAPILALSPQLVRTGVSLSTVSRSVISINPESEEAKKLREWYDSEGRGASTQAAGEGLASTSPGRSPPLPFLSLRYCLLCVFELPAACVTTLRNLFTASDCCCLALQGAVQGHARDPQGHPA